jgi:hypothetical protein
MLQHAVEVSAQLVADLYDPHGGSGCVAGGDDEESFRVLGARAKAAPPSKDEQLVTHVKRQRIEGDPCESGEGYSNIRIETESDTSVQEPTLDEAIQAREVIESLKRKEKRQQCRKLEEEQQEPGEEFEFKADPGTGPGRKTFRWDARSLQDLQEGRHPRQVKQKQLSRQRAERYLDKQVSQRNRWQEAHLGARIIPVPSLEAGSVPGIKEDLEQEAHFGTGPLAKSQQSSQLAEDYAPWRSRDREHVEKLTTVTERRWWTDNKRPRTKTAEAKKKSRVKLAEKHKQKGKGGHAS